MSPPSFDPTEHSHRRYNPLTQTWVLCSPHRTKRPWQGQTEPPQFEDKPDYDPKCYLCPGNARSGGDKRTPKYSSTFTFENDFAAVLPDAVEDSPTGSEDSLYRTEAVRGNCYVICFNPVHRLTLAEMDAATIVPIIEAWQQLYSDVSREPWARYIQIFENKGAMMGCSNPHPHGQSWCLSYVPKIGQTILDSQETYARKSRGPQTAQMARLSNGGRCLLLEYAQAELARPDRIRILDCGQHFVALVPYWALWPFEVMIMPIKRHIPHVVALTIDERDDLAEILRATTCRYDNLFKCSFPYSMGLYQSPTLDATEAAYAQMHLCFYPPLLRSASVRKFIAGFELFAEGARDITTEQAAGRLRSCDAQMHYKQRMSDP